MYVAGAENGTCLTHITEKMQKGYMTMDEKKRYDTQSWDTEAVRRRIMSEVDAAAEPATKKKRRKKKFKDRKSVV